jgi:hypothetical protein
MRTIKFKVYTFDELVVDAQQNAIEDNSDINVDYNWWNTTYDDAEDVGLKLTGFDLERNKHASGNFITNAKDCAEKIIGKHGNECDTYLVAQAYLSKTDIEDEDEHDERFLRNILWAYANMLEKECEYLQTENAIRETLIANSYEFTKDGKMYK